MEHNKMLEPNPKMNRRPHTRSKPVFQVDPGHNSWAQLIVSKVFLSFSKRVKFLPATRPTRAPRIEPAETRCRRRTNDKWTHHWSMVHLFLRPASTSDKTCTCHPIKRMKDRGQLPSVRILDYNVTPNGPQKRAQTIHGSTIPQTTEFLFWCQTHKCASKIHHSPREKRGNLQEGGHRGSTT